MKYAYFPGCAAKASAGEADQATHAIARRLDLELVSFPEFSCCGAGVLQEERPNLGSAINARNFAIAEKAELDIVTICNTCQLTMLKAKARLDGSPSLRDRVNRQLAEYELEYTGKVRIRHLLWILIEDCGLDELAAKVERRLDGVRVAPFYGCHILRPRELVAREDPVNPKSLDQLIAAVGACPVDHAAKTDCCGFHVMLVNQKTAVGRVGATMGEAKRAGADLVVTPCTLCQLTLDSYQHRAESRTGERIDLPVLHLPQLIGLALGIAPRELGLGRHLVQLPEELGLG
jgi:succinate dehydrogenase / fumarate reductase, cytochrome b subunit